MSKVEIHGRTYDIVPITDMSFGEARALKIATNGMNVREIEAGIDNLDPDALYGMILVSIRRVDPTYDERKLASLNMIDLVESIEEDEEEAPVAETSDPPPVAAAPPAAAPADPTTPQIASPGAETPAASGTPS